MKVTLKDIAEETGYSISTVSRVLNGSDKIGKQARREIYRTAKKLNYPIYHTLGGKKIIDVLNILFIVTGFHEGAFYSSLFHGMNKAAEKYNAQISFIFLNKPFEEILKTIRGIKDSKFEGLVLFTPEFDKDHYQRIKDE
ncbi:MAG TPA: LacI family DNA-binding transcriptional regulator, partial [Fodinibius sp.]|nr:LacI family DNA-binding transcriptional regulator [Fodinibius sp.]